MIVKNTRACPAPSILRRLVERRRDRVEEAVHQEDVDAERAAEVDHDEAGVRAEADRREHVAVLDHQQEDRGDGQQLREHLEDQECRQAEAATPEAQCARTRRHRERTRTPLRHS
jgi:hypothetical protein